MDFLTHWRTARSIFPSRPTICEVSLLLFRSFLFGFFKWLFISLWICVNVSGHSEIWQGEKYGAVRLTEVPPWSEASSGHSGKMFRGWRTQFAPLRPVAQPRNWNSASVTHLALWIIALGFVAGSEPGAVESLHHIHLSNGNKRHHIVPIAIHRSPASLRAGHSKYFLILPLMQSLGNVISQAVHHWCLLLKVCAYFLLHFTANAISSITYVVLSFFFFVIPKTPTRCVFSSVRQGESSLDPSPFLSQQSALHVWD